MGAGGKCQLKGQLLSLCFGMGCFRACFYACVNDPVETEELMCRRAWGELLELCP